LELGELNVGKVLAVDPGEVRIGLAVTDPSGVIARPLKVLRHHSRMEDIRAILLEAKEHEVERILIGIAFDLEGNVGPQARKALRLVEGLRECTSLPVETWDESGSTMRVQQQNRKDDMLDARAAAFILQEYLDEKGT
jgi:putative Holliday junction resolvase